MEIGKGAFSELKEMGRRAGVAVASGESLLLSSVRGKNLKHGREGHR